MAEHELEYGEQPLNQLMQELGLENAALVRASTEQLTFKMVAKARRGRYLSIGIRMKILRALQKATGNASYTLAQLFAYND